MTGPDRRAPRLHVSKPKHQVGDIITDGRTRWMIQQLADTQVTLEAANHNPTILWHTTTSHLKELR